MFDLPSWLWIVPVLSIIVFVHEMGHFLTARYFGITVTEFGFGFPPRICGVTYRGTVYSLNWLPLGGFVKMVGEEDPTDPGSFARQQTWKRALVLVSGSFMNLLLPLFIFTALLTFPHEVVVGDVRVSTVISSSPAHESGIVSGDVITHIDGEKIDNSVDLLGQTRSKLGKKTELLVRRSTLVQGLATSPDLMQVELVTVVPRLNPPRWLIVEQIIDPETDMLLSDARKYWPKAELGQYFQEGAIGLTIATVNPKTTERSFPLWKSLGMSFKKIWDIISATRRGISQWIGGGPDPGITGPVGIAYVTGEVSEVGMSPMLELIALISISLAILNLLPIPALDGGRLMFVLIEIVRNGKRVSPQKEGIVHFIGFIILVGFMLVMTYFDGIKILAGEGFLP